MQRKPEDVAAVVNALVVLLGPPLLMIAGSVILRDGSSDTSTVVVGDDPLPWWTRLGMFAPMLMYLAPFALLTGWRTHVHARRWREGTGSGWAGVAEAAIVAFAIAILVLAPGILTRPREAPPFVMVYGGAAIVLGLIVGVILRFTALVALKRMALAALVCLSMATAAAAQQRPPVPAEFLLAAGRAGTVEIGETAEKIYHDFGHERVRIAATFPEGSFQPVLEIRMFQNDPGPALAARVGEWPCPEYRVIGISVLDRRFRTVDGLGVGSTFADIRARYPNAKKGWGEGAWSSYAKPG